MVTFLARPVLAGAGMLVFGVGGTVPASPLSCAGGTRLAQQPASARLCTTRRRYTRDDKEKEAR
jgi:hypothetical protein